MNISEIMTRNPACCTPDMTLREVARMMVEHDCGEIPVCDQRQNSHVIGVITDRDVCCRAVADGMDVNTTAVSTCMTTPAVTCNPEMSLQDCCNLMEQNMIRRVPVVDSQDCIVGIVSQADIACKGEAGVLTEIVKQVSQPTEESSRVGSMNQAS